ncbi:helix-turn-helix domain-containing protein [Mycobacteroides chelonae]|uniref:Helix-turn-helix transcriptional regulator n=1 Tax=Mycobacteroides chelonae TaxID=1774 RepID=A0AB73U4Z9_MYCCH|nr:helix-turn-helix transcriptional regulator [Mycobacteroides chelonae]MEC4842626.1 helix-turn-helix transcriptional regulator [Mycobacteroides chelonae]MEC4847467.1 helix-turn-helix transcriptional regulator [Mycobacteroides chelonae]QDF71902.1 helix-turn-helix transcriptional regulator [Mycobacteroides chelonae]
MKVTRNLEVSEESRRAADLTRTARHLIRDLVAAREAKNLTAAEVAEMVGVHRSVISKFENQTEDPKLSTLLRYAHAVGVDLDFGVRQSNSRTPRRLRPGSSIYSPVGQTTPL